MLSCYVGDGLLGEWDIGSPKLIFCKLLVTTATVENGIFSYEFCEKSFAKSDGRSMVE